MAKTARLTDPAPLVPYVDPNAPTVPTEFATRVGEDGGLMIFHRHPDPAASHPVGFFLDGLLATHLDCNEKPLHPPMAICASRDEAIRRSIAVFTAWQAAHPAPSEPAPAADAATEAPAS